MSPIPHAQPSGCPLLPGTWLAGGLAFSLLAVTALLVDVHLRVSLFVRDDAAIWLGGGILMAVHMGCRRGRAPWHCRAREFSEHAGAFMLICLLGAISSYPIAAANHGFADARLEAIDRHLRFDWVSWYEVVARHPLLQHLSRFAYQSIFVTPAIVLAWLSFHGQRAEARRFIASFWIGALLTLTLFSAMPAEGPLAYLWHGPLPYIPVSALYQAQLIPELRHHALSSIDPDQLHGLVSAPSFHAASAVLFMAAGWRCGPLRWPIVALNCAMLLATPVEGTHYLADLVAGVAVALAALGMCDGLMVWAGRCSERSRVARVRPDGSGLLVRRIEA